jgi:hypothetical protein
MGGIIASCWPGAFGELLCTDISQVTTADPGANEDSSLV